ncbi:MAG: type II secretion system protein [Elusimicrobia bacterium]|nr:type II secretion system protein [Elusimicrobiota bacterium]
MKRRPTGFTLIELLVVCLIIGILATMGLSQYAKSVETAKADDAFAFTQSIAAANRMYALDHGGRYLTGTLTVADCPTGAADDCRTNTSACSLMWCGYLARQDLMPKPYTFCAGDAATECGAACDATMVACSLRKSPASTPYSTWGYTVTRQGVSTASDPSNMPAVQ